MTDLETFHREALAMLGRPASIDPARIEALRNRERELGVPIPPSFVAWYGVADGPEILVQHSNCDEPHAIEELGAVSLWLGGRAQHDWVREGVLPFMTENQAVCHWAIRLDGTDDPEVLVARDPDYAWRPCAPTFSVFVATHIWDYQEVFREGLTLVQSQDVPLRAEDLAFLRVHRRGRWQTHGWPGDEQYRFEGERTRILIWSGEDQADWFIASDSDAALVDELRLFWGCGTLAERAWASDPRGDAVLKQLRRTAV